MSGCPICERGEPLDVIAERRYTWITAGADPPEPGYVCVVNKRHVVEPFELEGEERAAFWEDVLDTADRVQRLLGSRKVNYEIHGNTIPHLHAHLYQRFDDPPPHDVEAIRKALA
jgi:diadenosine tetraphosphate (Ap4A) HIT family hydrolase